MPATVSVRCARCRAPFTARVADRKRGWAKFCGKSCKAKDQTARTGVGAGGGPAKRYLANGGWVQGSREYDRHGVFVGLRMSLADLSYGGYGDADQHSAFGEGKW